MVMLAKGPWPQRYFTVGADIGKVVDPTAIAVLETLLMPADGDLSSIRSKVTTKTHHVRHLDKLPLGTGYPAVAQHLAGIMAQPALRDHRFYRETILAVDRTGVGMAIWDILKAGGLRPYGITFTNGRVVNYNAGGAVVGTTELVSTLEAAMHAGRIKIAASLPDTPALQKELADFRVRFSSAGHAIFEAREGRHDDLVMALIVALWKADRGGPNAYSFEFNEHMTAEERRG